jgi:hypothetical protein
MLNWKLKFIVDVGIKTFYSFFALKAAEHSFMLSYKIAKSFVRNARLVVVVSHIQHKIFVPLIYFSSSHSTFSNSAAMTRWLGLESLCN